MVRRRRSRPKRRSPVIGISAEGPAMGGLTAYTKPSTLPPKPFQSPKKLWSELEEHAQGGSGRWGG